MIITSGQPVKVSTATRTHHFRCFLAASAYSGDSVGAGYGPAAWAEGPAALFAGGDDVATALESIRKIKPLFDLSEGLGHLEVRSCAWSRVELGDDFIDAVVREDQLEETFPLFARRVDPSPVEDAISDLKRAPLEPQCSGYGAHSGHVVLGRPLTLILRLQDRADAGVR